MLIENMDDAVAAALLRIIQSKMDGLRLDDEGWRELREAGHSRADVRKAIDRLLDAGEITATTNSRGVVILEFIEEEILVDEILVQGGPA